MSEWRPVPQFEGYFASEDGKIASTRQGSTRTLRYVVMANGYCVVALRKCGKTYRKLVHRIVLEAFKGTCPNGMECCHGPDENKQNNALENLRWDTHKSNIADLIQSGKSGLKQGGMQGGEKCPAAKLTRDRVDVIRQEYGTGVFSMARLAERHGMSKGAIQKIVEGKSWKPAEAVA